MEKKMQFYYLGKGWRSNPLKCETFKAYKFKDNETGKVTLYPIKDEDSKEIFIYGHGYKKIAKSKVIDVPVFDLNADNWDNYREKYGDYCLYYSIDGTDLDDRDCCATPKQNEYKSIIITGVRKFTEFINLFNKFADIQLDIIKCKYLPLIREYSCYNVEHLLDGYLFKPCYNIFYTFFNVSSQPDVLNDDKRMESLYRDYRSAVLKSQSEEYQRYLELEEEKRQFRENYRKENNVKYFGIDYVPTEIYIKYEKLVDRCSECFNKVTKEIDSIVDKEINTDNDVFPTSVEDRIKFLFGEEASNLYNELVDKFLSTEE